MLQLSVLFEAARRAGRVHELDRPCRCGRWRRCRTRALLHRSDCSSISNPLRFGRIEAPTGLRAAPREWGIGLVIELTERALTDDPARLLALADWAGRVNSTWPQGDGATGPALPVGVALDDVGADPTPWR